MKIMTREPDFFDPIDDAVTKRDQLGPRTGVLPIQSIRTLIARGEIHSSREIGRAHV